MNQLTVRGFDQDLEESIRRVAKRGGTSLNQAALKLLRKGAGLGNERSGADTVGPSLDHLIGTWSSADAEDLKSALAEFETIDEADWK